MCLTEPQAGSDLAAVRTKAIPDGDRYRISGQKIFITFGEHDLAPNIIHLVLARLPDAPEGTKGISLFIVPKVLVNADGSLGERNDVFCAGIEHKLGINGNPTCTLNYGEKGGAIGYLVGEPNRGLEYMFIMMNAARFSTGVQGLAIADRAYQSALAYAKERLQSREVAGNSRSAAPIIKHPDVRRMLMSMKAQIEAMRALSVRLRGVARLRAQSSRCWRAQRAQSLHRIDDPGRQRLVQRDGDRAVLDGGPSLRRHGLHRRDGHRATVSRCQDRLDLRGHDRHSGARSRRP